MGNLGPKSECIPIFFQFGQCLTKALKVPGLVGISRIWGHSEPHTCGQTTSEVAKNWCSGFGPKFTVEFEEFFQKKNGLAYILPTG